MKYSSPAFTAIRFPFNDQRVAALHDQHVFVVLMNVEFGRWVVLACPERHLAAFRPTEDIALDSQRRLIAFRDFIQRSLHEGGKVVHKYALKPQAAVVSSTSAISAGEAFGAFRH